MWWNHRCGLWIFHLKLFDGPKVKKKILVEFKWKIISAPLKGKPDMIRSVRHKVAEIWVFWYFVWIWLVAIKPRSEHFIQKLKATQCMKIANCVWRNRDCETKRLATRKTVWSDSHTHQQHSLTIIIFWSAFIMCDCVCRFKATGHWMVQKVRRLQEAEGLKRKRCEVQSRKIYEEPNLSA